MHKLLSALFVIGALLSVGAPARAQDAGGCSWLNTDPLRFDFYSGSTNTSPNIGNVDGCIYGQPMIGCTLDLNGSSYTVYLTGDRVAPNKVFKWKLSNRDIQVYLEGTCEAGDDGVIGLRWYSTGAQTQGSASNRLRAEARTQFQP